MEVSAKLNDLQLDLLKMFSHNISDSQLIEIRELLKNFFANKAVEEMDKLWDENNWDDDTIEKLVNELELSEASGFVENFYRNNYLKNIQLSALKLKTKNFKFNREEA